MNFNFALLQLPRVLTPEAAGSVTWEVVISGGLRVLIALLVASFAFWVLRLLTIRLERSIGEGDPSPATLGEQRAKTLVGLLRSVGLVVILIVTLFTLLSIVGVDIRPLLAGAGVVSLAISLGAQSLVRDVLSGLFILFENQFGVGDVVRIGDAGGLVEKMTLRIVVLRDVHGVVHVIPNGEISRVSNMRAPGRGPSSTSRTKRTSIG